MNGIFLTLGAIMLCPLCAFAQAPTISVTPDSLSENLFSGKSNSQTLTVHNNGSGDLTFEMNIRERLGDSLISRNISTTESRYINNPDQSGASTSQDLSNRQQYGGTYIPSREQLRTFPRRPNLPERSLSGGLNLLLVTSAGGPPDEIRNALLSLSDIQVVDVFDASSGTPTLTQLLPYHAVIAMNNFGFHSPVALGDVLADYVDAGRGLVLTVATFCCCGFEIQGRLLNEGYFPFNIGGGPVGSASLGTFNPNHPIMRGVTNATGDNLAEVTVADSAELVARWSTGWPLVATKGHNVAAVNIFVPNPGGWTGDIPQILHNAAFWAGGCDWLSAEPDTGTVPAGSSLAITMNFDAARLSGGEYDASIVISSNDSVTPELTIPAHLNVTDAPAISVERDSIDFGEVFLGVTDTCYLRVSNIGSQDLLIFTAAIQPASYTVHPTFAGIDPGDNEIFRITFLPQVVGNYPGTLTFSSNDPLLGNYVIPVRGQGVEPPVIVVSPESLIIQLAPGDSTTQTLTIHNNGESSLYFNLSGGFSSTNYALQYNGTSTYVRCPNSPSLNITQSITFEAWVYSFDWEGNPRIFEKGGVGGGGPDLQYRFEAENGELHMALYPVSSDVRCPLPSTNTWHHCAGVYDYAAHQIKLYLDGAKVQENLNATGQIATTSDALYIGTKCDGAWPMDWFNGVIDEIRIWSIARSENDIRQYMTRQLTGAEPGLAAYWQFNEGTGTTTADKTVNANHGALLGGVAWTVSSAPIRPAWLTMSADSGTCPPHLSTDIVLSFDATEVDTGEYHASVIINSSDPFTPRVVVPIHMIVTAAVGVEDEVVKPLTYTLEQNFPNPFNPLSNFGFRIAKSGMVELVVFDLLGRQVATLVNEPREPGVYTVQWDASGVSSGVYFYRLTAGNFVQTRKMVVVR